jgi:Helix-turn-helix domain
VSVQAIGWVLDYSRARLTDRLVLISIANHAKKDGSGAWPSIKAIAEEAHISQRQAQRSIRALAELGELAIEEAAGPHGSHLYSLPGMSPRQAVTPDESGSSEVTYPVETDGEIVTRTVIEPNRPEPSLAAPSVGSRSNALAKVYHDRQPMSRFPAIAGIARTALDAGFPDAEVAAALLRLADDRRPVTVETLRIELEGLPPRRRTESAAAQTFREAQQLKAMEAEG